MIESEGQGQNPIVDSYLSRIIRSGPRLSPAQLEEYRAKCIAHVGNIDEIQPGFFYTYNLSAVPIERPKYDPYVYMAFFPIILSVEEKKIGIERTAFINRPQNSQVDQREMDPQVIATRILKQEIPEHVYTVNNEVNSKDHYLFADMMEPLWAKLKVPTIVLTLNQDLNDPESIEPTATIFSASGISLQSALTITKAYAQEGLQSLL